MTRIRVSTEDQAKGNSPEIHEARAREYAKFNEWAVAEVYDLAGVSGKSVMEHPECKRMMADIRTLTRPLQDTTAKSIHRANYTMRNGSGWTFKPESEWHVHEVERLVSDEVWDECNRLIDDSFSQQKRPAKKPVHIFAGVAHCECGEKMYVPSNSPKYVCRACRNKIGIADLSEIYMEEIKDYSPSPESVANYLKSSNDTAAEKERLLAVQREELLRVEREIRCTYDLYQAEKIDADGFNQFYQPLQEQRKQLEAAIPRLEAELDILKVNSLSAEEISAQVANLYKRWQTWNRKKSANWSNSSPTGL